MKNVISLSLWLNLVNINVYTKVYQNIPLSSRDRTIFTFSEFEPRQCLGQSQRIGLHLVNINAYAKIYQNIPNGLRVIDIFSRIFTNRPASKSSQTVRWQNQMFDYRALYEIQLQDSVDFLLCRAIAFFASKAFYECKRDTFCIQQAVSNSTIRRRNLYTNTDSHMLVKPVWFILWKIKAFFKMCQAHRIMFSLSVYCIKIQAPITWEGSTGKKSRTINRSICTSVTSAFKTSWREGHFWSYAGAKSIIKRLFAHQNKEKAKQLLTTIEYATINKLISFENLTFFLCFNVIVLKQRF